MPDNHDYVPRHSYQDDLDSHDADVDPIMNERPDDPVKEFGVPAEEFKSELDEIAIDEDLLAEATEEEKEDARERIEDLDEDPDQESLAA